MSMELVIYRNMSTHKDTNTHDQLRTNFTKTRTIINWNNTMALTMKFDDRNDRVEYSDRQRSPSAVRGAGFCTLAAVSVALILGLAPAAPTSAQSAGTDVEAKLMELLPPETAIEGIAESPMPGVYEVSVGGRTVYVHATEAHVLIGEAYDLGNKQSLLDMKQTEKMADVMSSTDVGEMIVMGPNASKRHITIFTDIDCGYCRKLHDEVPALNAAGVQIRYLMFPRAGIGSESFDKAVSVWCADDQADAITVAKGGGTVDPKVCENPVESQYNLGVAAGVRGTPTMILDDGTVIPGYVPKDKLLTELGISAN